MSRDRVRTAVALVLAVVLGGGAVAYGAFQLQKVRAIERGPAVAARATDWTVIRSRNRTTYRARYVFTADGAEHVGGPVRVSQEVRDRTRPLVVRYAPARPDWSLPEDAIDDAKSDAAFALFSGALVIVFVLTALTLMWAAKRRRAAAAQLAAPADNFPKDPAPGSQ